MQVSLASFPGGGLTGAGAGTGTGGLAVSPPRMDPTRLSPPPSGVNGLISMFEVLNTTSATPSSTGLFTRTHRRWRYSCPSINIPLSLARHHHHPYNFDNGYEYRDPSHIGGSYGNYQERHTSSLSLHSFNPHSAHSLSHDSSLSPDQSRTPASSSVVSIASDPARLSEPKLPADILTVSERRKLFETSGSARPRTSGGEQSSRTTKFSLVSSFTTGPTRQLAPPAPIHTKQHYAHNVDTSVTTDISHGDFLASKCQGQKREKAHCRDSGGKDMRPPGNRGYQRDWNREWDRDLDLHHQYAMRRPTSPSDSQRRFNWALRGSRSLAPIDAPGQTPRLNATILNETCRMPSGATAAPISTADLSPARTITTHTFVTGAVSPQYAKSETAGYVGEDSLLYDGRHHEDSRSSRDHDVVPDKRTTPRHVSVPEWYAEGPQEFVISHKLGTEQLPELPAKPCTPDTTRFLDISQSHATPGRASLPPPTSKTALVTSPGSQSYAADTTAFWRASSPASIQSDCKGTVRSLKKLFDSSPSASRNIQAPDSHKRHRAVPASPSAGEDYVQTQSAGLRFPHGLSELSGGGVGMRITAAVKSPEGSPRKDSMPDIPNSPLRLRIGQFESLSQHPESPRNCATNESVGARHRSLEAIQWFRDVQSSRKSKGLKSWKKLPNLWVRTIKDDSSSAPQRKKHAWPALSQNSSATHTHPDPSWKPTPQYFPTVPRKPVQLVGSRPLVARAVPIITGADLEVQTVWKHDGPPCSSNSMESHRSGIEAPPQVVNVHHQPNIAPVLWHSSGHDFEKRESRPSSNNPQASFSEVTSRSITDSKSAGISVQVTRQSSRNIRSGKYGSTTRVTWGRRQVSTKKRTVISNVQCGLQHPKPVRSYETNKLVSLCRDQSIKRTTGRGYEGL